MAKRKLSKKVSTSVKIEKETREFDTAEYVQMIADIYDILWPGGHHDAEWDSDTASDIALTFFARDLGPKQS